MLATLTGTDHPMKPAPADPTLDFALLQHSEAGNSERNRWALLWLLGLLVLLLATIVALVLYLQNFEAEEDERRRVADTQWIEQSVRFHFNRLEDDMAAVARRVLGSGKPNAPDRAADVTGGLLWSEVGVIRAHGWLPAGDRESRSTIARMLKVDASAHPVNTESLAIMQDITRGLRRPAYAGLMRQANGTPTDVIWLAVPVFERGTFIGDYLASLSLDAAVAGLVPGWFLKNHQLRLVDVQSLSGGGLPAQNLHLANLNLQGADLALQVQPLKFQPAQVPRMFFLVALLFLLGMLASLYALRRDFGKRQRVEALLQAQIALRTAMENSVTIGLRAWALDGRILYVNQAFCRMVGFEARELLGQGAPLPYWPKEQTDELQTLHRHVIEQGTQDAGMEVQFQHRDGRLIDVLIHEAPLSATSGEQLGWMSSVLDISERKQAERMAARQQERLEASGRLVAMGEVASTLAHELNQPLGALSSFASGLMNRMRNGRITFEEMGPIVERMNQLSDKAGRIIQRVNDFARRHEMSRQRLDLVAFTRRATHQWRAQGPVVLRVLLPQAPVWVEADAMLLEHAVHNVLSNAMHWSQLGGGSAIVQLSVASDENFASIVVSDNGPGVSEEQKEHIFSAFFSATEDGMGMGLAICRSVVEAHHGRIDVGRDEDLGGARFALWLPLADWSAAAEAGPSEAGGAEQAVRPPATEPHDRMP